MKIAHTLVGLCSCPLLLAGCFNTHDVPTDEQDGTTHGHASSSDDGNGGWTTLGGTSRGETSDSASDDSSTHGSTGDGGTTNGSSDDGPGVEPCTMANPPGDLSLDGVAFPRTAPQATWSEPSRGCAETLEYEVVVGTASGLDDLRPAVTVGNATQWDGILSPGSPLPGSTMLYLSVRAIDGRGNVSDWRSEPFSIWTPDALPDVMAWLDFADPTVVFADTACTQAVANDGEIGCVQDKSGNGNDFSTNGDDPGPLYSDGSLAGLPAADFSGPRILRAASSASLSPGTTALTVAVVDAPASVVQPTASLGGYILYKDDEYQFSYFSGNLQVAIDSVASGSWAWQAGPIPTLPDTQLNVFVHDDDVWHFRRDGMLLDSSPAAGGQSGALNNSQADVVLGGRFDGNNTSLAYGGRQGELVLISAALDAAAMADLERYFLERWSL